MWDSRLSRPVSILIALLCLSLLTSCPKDLEPAPTPPTNYAQDVVCTEGNKSKNKPQICVDNMGIPNPLAIESWDYESDGQGKKTQQRVKVTWFASRSDADLKIKFDDERCVKRGDVKCKKNGGECTATIRAIDWEKVEPGKPKAEKTLNCGYKTTITLDGKTIDPDGDLIVNPCCT